MRSRSRVCDASIDTVTELLVDVGRAWEQLHDKEVRNVQAKNIQCDEIWSIVSAKLMSVPEGMEGATGNAGLGRVLTAIPS